MPVSRRILARHIAEKLAGGANKAKLMDELAAYLVAHKQTGQLEMIIADIARNLAELGTVRAKVTVARPLTAELKSAISGYVKRVEDAKTAQIEETLNPGMIGGIIIETPKKRFDASVTTQLKRLRNV